MANLSTPARQLLRFHTATAYGGAHQRDTCCTLLRDDTLHRGQHRRGRLLVLVREALVNHGRARHAREERWVEGRFQRVDVRQVGQAVVRSVRGAQTVGAGNSQFDGVGALVRYDGAIVVWTEADKDCARQSEVEDERIMRVCLQNCSASPSPPVTVGWNVGFARQAARSQGGQTQHNPRSAITSSHNHMYRIVTHLHTSNSASWTAGSTPRAQTG